MLDTDIIEQGPAAEAPDTPARQDGGPRRPRVHNARLLGRRAYQEVPAKDKRKRRNKAQRDARKLSR